MGIISHNNQLSFEYQKPAATPDESSEVEPKHQVADGNLKQLADRHRCVML